MSPTELALRFDHYQPMELGVGDACYFDSTMGHACVAGDEDARVLWVCSDSRIPGADGDSVTRAR
jgi:hypothetical protein